MLPLNIEQQKESTSSVMRGTAIRAHRSAEVDATPNNRAKSPKGKKIKLGKSVTLYLKEMVIKVRQTRTSLFRIGVQTGFVLLSIWLGIRFYDWYSAVSSGVLETAPIKPPGVEGYLPISGWMGTLDWIYHGTLNNIHPAATILFLIFVGLSLLLRKSFCGWICPVGFLSESLGRLGAILFKRNYRLPKWLDITLRGIKYLLLGFFAWAIFTMPPLALRAFIESPYNKVSDVKMMMFFVDMGMVGAIVIAVLVMLSVPIYNFWCRYLCPYGALMGLFSWASPVKVRRDPISCTDCGMCDKVCPSRLPVMSKETIISPECIGCGDCVTSCPVPSALRMGTTKQTLSPKRFAIILVSLFVVGWIGAQVTGVWHSDLTNSEAQYHIENMNGPEYGHPGR